MNGHAIVGKSLLTLGCSAFLSIIAAGHAGAATLDIQTSGSSGFVNGGFFQQVSNNDAAGTGKIHSFLRLQANGNTGVEQGYNTSHRNQGNPKTQFDEKVDPNFTRTIKLSDVPIVKLGNVNYRQFILDINEPNDARKALITLENLQLFTSNYADLGAAGRTYNTATGDFGSNATKVFDLDVGADGNSSIVLKDINQGSGRYDMLAYIPDSAFKNPSAYLYLYSKFSGADDKAGGGFEEWAVGTPKPGTKEVPEPTAAAALGLIAAGSLRFLKRRLVA